MKSGKEPSAPMGSRATISKEDVARAIDGMLDAGLNPTQKGARDILGRGSFNTIGPIFREIMASKLPVPVNPAEMSGLKAKASELEALARSLEQEIRTIREERDREREIADKLRERAAAVEARLKDKEERLAESLKEREREAQERARVEDRAYALERDLLIEQFGVDKRIRQAWELQSLLDATREDLAKAMETARRCLESPLDSDRKDGLALVLDGINERIKSREGRLPQRVLLDEHRF